MWTNSVVLILDFKIHRLMRFLKRTFYEYLIIETLYFFMKIFKGGSFLCLFVHSIQLRKK